MSPRSEEFAEQARKRLAALATIDPAAHPEAAVSLAYYAMLYAARAALSERDRYARTHKGTWQLTRELLVAGGELDEELVAAAQRLQATREAGDYQAVTPTTDQARRAVGLARDFVAAVERRFG